VLDGIARREDEVLRDEEQDGADDGGDPRGDGPRAEDLGDAGPAPADIGPADGGDAGADEAADDGVCGADGQAVAGGDGEEGRGRDDGTHHGEQENGRVVVVQVRVDDLGADGLGDARADGRGAGELHDARDGDGLLHGQGARRDGRCEGVGDIVGAYKGIRRLVIVWDVVAEGRVYTDVPGVEEGEYSGQGKDVVILMKDGRHPRSGDMFARLWAK
jgi:hypothetical protein